MTGPDQAPPPGPAQPHLVPLGRTGWSLWREGGLRSAGFPAAGLLAVCDPELARAADESAQSSPGQFALGQPGSGRSVTGRSGPGQSGPGPSHPGRSAASQPGPALAAAWPEASARLSAAVAAVAAGPAFREAVAWQNPALIGTCLNKLVRGEPRNVRGRLHESTVVRYLQRYLLKNDTIGFFGPVGWATLDPSVPGLTAEPGEQLLAGRTTHFEVWTVDEVARSLAKLPGLARALIPRPALAVALTGTTLHRPLRLPAELTAAEAALLRRCDGRATVREVLAGTPNAAAGLRALARLAQLGGVHLGLDGPVDSWPERALRTKVEAAADGPDRAAALARLDALTAARDALGAARGAEDVVKLTGELAGLFSEVTGASATRRPGEAYAGRTLVYLDSRRDVRVTVGRVILDALAAPLGLLLDSAHWLAGRAAAGYRTLLDGWYDEEVARTGSPDVPLGYLIARAAPELTAAGATLPAPVRAAVTEFQDRWRRVLPWSGEVSRHTVTARELADGVAREFGGAGPVPWRAARYHSPDVLIAAVSPEAASRADFQLVLGELHLTVNTLDNRFFTQHHDEPARLLAAVEADAAGQRIYAALPKSSPFVSSRVWPPVALTSPQYTYWSWSGDPSSVDPPGPVLPGAALTVHRVGGALRVRAAAGGPDYDLLEVLGEILSTAVVNAFRPFASAPHRPRITVDRLVIARESWTFPAAEASWAFVRDEAARYAAARAWRAEHSLPERVFAVLPVERKPIATDFTSLPLVNILAKEIRRTHEAGPLTFTVSEMLPDLGELWLPDAAGQRYASEFRLVAVDPAVR